MHPNRLNSIPAVVGVTDTLSKGGTNNFLQRAASQLPVGELAQHSGLFYYEVSANCNLLNFTKQVRLPPFAAIRLSGTVLLECLNHQRIDR